MAGTVQDELSSANADRNDTWGLGDLETLERV